LLAAAVLVILDNPRIFSQFDLRFTLNHSAEVLRRPKIVLHGLAAESVMESQSGGEAIFPPAMGGHLY
jgi:hypothetical protein